MGDQDNAKWWVLHLRVARGENLAPEEQELYRSQLKDLHDDESTGGDLETLRQLRVQVNELKQENGQLLDARTRLDSEIDALEAALSERARHALGV